jgi:hypothetical protein
MSQVPDPPGNSDYYAARAVEERRLAMSAKDSNARAAHLELAEKYEQLAQSDDRGGEVIDLVPRQAG